MPNCTIIESKIVNENKILENLFAGWRARKHCTETVKPRLWKKQVEIISEIRYNDCAAG